MLYAQFYHEAVGGNKLIPACGDRSVVILDARRSKVFNEYCAKEECIKRGYKGYRLYKGETFTRSQPISIFIPVTDKRYKSIEHD